MLRVGDLQRSINFYTRHFGMTVRRTTDRPEQKYTLAFLGYGRADGEGPGTEVGEAEIELTYNYGVDQYDIGRDPRVNVVFADPDDNAYVSISGQAAVVDDPQRARELWSNMAQAWFPGGPEDPALALVKVGITHADYWDVKDNKLVQVFKMVKAAATGQPPKDMADHGRVRMG